MNVTEKAVIGLTKFYFHSRFKSDKSREIKAEGITEHIDIRYTGRDGNPLLMDVFEPARTTPESKLPVIIYVHGGGLIEGSKELSAGFCRLLAKKGFLVFSLEYRLVPDVRVYEQFNDVCAGLDAACEMLEDFNADRENVFMTGESAGSYLALYTAAITNSEKLQKASGCRPADLSIKALGLISGMLYTKRKDALGIFLSGSFYGKSEQSKAFKQYTDPEHPEILQNIPPCYLMTSKEDVIENYTVDFAKVLEKNGIENKLRHMGDGKALIHAFPVIRPYLPESADVIEEMTAWFARHSK